jgi:indolepyruvate ferredoxin oxidoreductase, alpha subunit
MSAASCCRRCPSAQEQDKVKNRWPAALKFIRENGLNEHFGPDQGRVGIICQGGMYNAVIRALQRLGLADLHGQTSMPLHVLNVTYPLVEDELLDFCAGKDAVLVVEEGQPAFIEQTLAGMLYRAGAKVKLHGKDTLPMAGEYTGQVMLDGVEAFLRKAAPELLPAQVRAPNAPAPEIPDLSKTVPIRPPGFCTGCPERPIFAAMKLVQEELGEHQIAGDIGCHLFASLPPFNIGGATMGYGLGPASNGAFDGGGEKRPIASWATGGFWHNGLSSPRSATWSTTSPTASWSSSTISTRPRPAGRTCCPRAPRTRPRPPTSPSRRRSGASAWNGCG